MYMYKMNHVLNEVSETQRDQRVELQASAVNYSMRSQYLLFEPVAEASLQKVSDEVPHLQLRNNGK